MFYRQRSNLYDGPGAKRELSLENMAQIKNEKNVSKKREMMRVDSRKTNRHRLVHVGLC